MNKSSNIVFSFNNDMDTSFVPYAIDKVSFLSIKYFNNNINDNLFPVIQHIHMEISIIIIKVY